RIGRFTIVLSLLAKPLPLAVSPAGSKWMCHAGGFSLRCDASTGRVASGQIEIGIRIDAADLQQLDQPQGALPAHDAGPGADVRLWHDGVRLLPPGPCP